MLFCSLVEGFLLNCQLSNLSDNTIFAYENAFCLVAEYLNDPEVETITGDDLRQHSQQLHQRTRFSAGHRPFMEKTDDALSPWTIHHYLRPIRTLYIWALSTGMLQHNPAKGLKFPIIPRGRVDRFPEKEWEYRVHLCRPSDPLTAIVYNQRKTSHQASPRGWATGSEDYTYGILYT